MTLNLFEDKQTLTLFIIFLSCCLNDKKFNFRATPHWILTFCLALDNWRPSTRFLLKSLSLIFLWLILLLVKYRCCRMMNGYLFKIYFSDTYNIFLLFNLWNPKYYLHFYISILKALHSLFNILPHEVCMYVPKTSHISVMCILQKKLKVLALTQYRCYVKKFHSAWYRYILILNQRCAFRIFRQKGKYCGIFNIYLDF